MLHAVPFLLARRNCVSYVKVGPAALPLVDQYKHLGVVQAGAGCIRREIHKRCAAAWTAFREGRTRVFRCKRVSLRRRGILLNMLVLSKLLYGAGAWPPLKVGEMRKFTGALFSIYRATLGLRATDDQHLSVSAICTLLDLPDPATLLRIEQLRYLKTALLCCPGCPVGLAPVRWTISRTDQGLSPVAFTPESRAHAHGLTPIRIGKSGAA